MNIQTSNILEQLSLVARAAGTPLDDSTKEQMAYDIDYKLMKGWTPNEVVQHMSYMEHVSPQYDEEFALWMMKIVRQNVEARLLTNQ